MNGEEKRIHCPDCRTTYLQGERHGCVKLPPVTAEMAQAIADARRSAGYPADAKPGRGYMSPQDRKQRPLARGVLDYFPDALMEVAYASYVATQQHHPDKGMHWDKEKSTDEADCILRHLKDRGTLDIDGVRHSAKVAWRALALLQRELEG